MRASRRILALATGIAVHLVCAPGGGAEEPASKLDSPIVWAPDMEAALMRARSENKPVLIVFSGRRQEVGFTGY